MSKQNAILRPLGLATVLALGFGLVIGILFSWGYGVWEEINRSNMDLDRLTILLDGTPLIAGYHDGKYEYHTIDGKKIKLPTENAIFANNEVLVGPKDLEKIRSPLKARERIQPFSDQLTPATFWYFIHDRNLDGKGYFVGYDSKLKRHIGYIGRLGFSKDMPLSENWFPMDGRGMFGANPNRYKTGINPGYPVYAEPRQGEPEEMDIDTWKVVMISDDQLLQINLRARSVTTLAKLSDMLSICEINAFMPIPDKPTVNNMKHHYLAVRTMDKVILLDAAGKQVRTYEIPEDLRRRSFTFYDIGDEKAIISHKRVHPDLKVGDELTWIDTSGKILRREEVLAKRTLMVLSRTDYWRAILAAPEPISMILCMAVLDPIFGYLDIEAESHYAGALARSLMESWQALIVVCIIAAVLAWVCYQRQRRMALPWTWVWVGFVFLGGVPGFLGYLFHRRWPVLQNCHVCGHAVPHDRELCSSCGSEFPGPELKGIEVFA